MTEWWQFALAIAGALTAAIVSVGFLVGSWHGIDRHETSRRVL